ncbi:hypothetical protein [Fictibacillus sp. JL2B1089]|uniref:hypothetical protein n=1 Tax=Fictibacillus sp. JL2B1089 TaxID=3399565 RepID=UPI003A884752
MNQFEQIEPSANNVEVAEPQVQEHSENISEVADPIPVQDAETNAHYAEQRRKQELDEYRSKSETFEQRLNRIAQFSGYQTHDELLQAVEEAERQREREEYEAAGIDPDQFNQLIEKHPDIQFAREQRAKQEEEAKFGSEIEGFLAKHPDIQPNEIPQEVWAIREQEGLPLLHAYRSYMFDNVRQQSEQAAIQKLQQNSLSTPGALGLEGSDHKTSYSQLSTSEKAKLREQVLRGEKTNLF